MFVSILYKFNIYIHIFWQGIEFLFVFSRQMSRGFLQSLSGRSSQRAVAQDLTRRDLHWGDLQGSPRTAVDMQILEAQKLLGWFQSLFFRCFWFWVDCESSPKLDRWKLMEHHEEVKSPSRKLRDDPQLFVQQPGLRPLVEVIRPKKPKSGLP